jgi:chlorophyll(ide) b reductase
MKLFSTPASTTNLKVVRGKKRELKVVVTGGTKGLGRAMTERFAETGDKVFVVARNAPREEFIHNKLVHGFNGDVGKPDIYGDMFESILEVFDGEIDLFINCAAMSGGYRTLNELDDDTIETIVTTNLLGTAMCSKHAYQVMHKQESGGNIFNFLGNGSNGFPTPNYSMYGSTKIGIKHLTDSLCEEWQKSDVNVHTVSPGLMVTDLLMDNLSPTTFGYIKSMCSTPDLVAHHMVPRFRSAYYTCKKRETMTFLTVPKIIYKGLCGAAACFNTVNH